MMREILFRGKENPSGEWVEGFLVGNCHIGDWVSCTPIHSKTVGQFTGLTDKNGQKIFEGDIISGLGNTYVCRWDEGNVEFTVFDGKESFGLAYAAYPCMEVVGNIHDNPELLEVSDGN